ncbi:MAG: hypothetical protein HY657_10505 [Acidobacteria bacterium]|nr:hypothetical protein [Acidobacteriota bacterium]
MDRDEIRRQIDVILNKHDEAFLALQAVRQAMSTANEATRGADTGTGAAISGMRPALEGLASANEALLEVSRQNRVILDAHGRAIDAALHANQASLAFLRQIDGNGQS